MLVIGPLGPRAESSAVPGPGLRWSREGCFPQETTQGGHYRPSFNNGALTAPVSAEKTRTAALSSPLRCRSS